MIQHGRAGIKEILQSRMFKGESQRTSHFWSELLLAVNPKHIGSIAQNCDSRCSGGYDGRVTSSKPK